MFLIPCNLKIKKEVILSGYPECEQQFRFYFWSADSHKSVEISPQTLENLWLLPRSNTEFSQQLKPSIFKQQKATFSLFFYIFILFLDLIPFSEKKTTLSKQRDMLFMQTLKS